MFNVLLGAVIDLNGRPRYLHPGWFLISVANLAVILADDRGLRARDLAPVPARNRGGRMSGRVGNADVDSPRSRGGCRGAPAREAAARPPAGLRRLWIYVFGVLSLAAFVVVLVSRRRDRARRAGVVAHLLASVTSSTALHLWSTELFFFFMVVHLWGKFFMAAWRGRRALTWITGAIAFLVSIATAFTGYLTQQNLDSQWIGGQAKDGLNAAGIGAFFNVLNFGQMLLWHVVLAAARSRAADRRSTSSRSAGAASCRRCRSSGDGE